MRTWLARLLIFSSTLLLLAASIENAISEERAPRPPSLQIAPDCSEKKVTIDDLLAIEKRPDVRSVQDFLRSVPRDSLQTFTFVHRSNSLQHHKVDSQWPRTLRMSADGKLALSFVCNPASQDYGRIEILHYVDPPIAAWRTASLDFRPRQAQFGALTDSDLLPLLTPGRPGGRVHHNEPVCAKCHSAAGDDRSEIRPVLGDYNTWDGFYGSDDDVVHPNSKEYLDYVSFLKKAESDACYGTLPWPKVRTDEYALYPYHEGFDIKTTDLTQVPLWRETEKIKINNYDLRPNLKFTDTFSHLMAQRLAWELLRKPQYHQIAPILMMEAARCDDSMVSAELTRRLPGYVDLPDDFTSTFMDPRTHQSQTRHLYAAGLLLDISTADFGMHFTDHDNPYYNTGAAGVNRRDTSIARMAQGVLMDELAREFPTLKKYYRRARGVSEFFAPQDFSCVDDVAGPVVLDTIEAQAAICTELSAIASSSRRTSVASNVAAPMSAYADIEPLVQPKPNDIATATARMRSDLSQRYVGASDPAAFARGQSLLQTCTNCHGASSSLPRPYQFLRNELTLRSRLHNEPVFIWTLLTYLESGRMPKNSSLSREQILDLQAYFLEIAR